MKNFSNCTPDDFAKMTPEELDAYSDWFEKENESWLSVAREAFAVLKGADKTVVENPIKRIKVNMLIGELIKYYKYADEDYFEIETVSDQLFANTFTVNLRAVGWGGKPEEVTKIISLCDEYCVQSQERPDRVLIEFVFNDFYSITYDKSK